MNLKEISNNSFFTLLSQKKESTFTTKINTMPRNYFDLNINAPLFTELSKLPEWWKTIINDNSLYVNVRKNNRVNVYYRGASIMELSMNRNKSIQGKYIPNIFK